MAGSGSPLAWGPLAAERSAGGGTAAVSGSPLEPASSRAQRRVHSRVRSAKNLAPASRQPLQCQLQKQRQRTKASHCTMYWQALR